ncbi:internalin A [Bacilli bacterium PM5-9]|nr:internalin A [Bacilli bacterium PM5-9]
MKKKTILLCILFILGCFVKIDATSNLSKTPKSITTRASDILFNDTKVEEAVRKSLALGDSDAITSENIIKLKSITFTKSGIYDLSGLEAATQLTTIKVDTSDKKAVHFNSFASLSNIKISSLTFISEVNFNDISELTLFKKTLTHVRFSSINKDNDFTFLSNLTKLSILTIGTTNGKIPVDLSPLKDITSLTRITLTYIDLNDTLDLSKNTKLRFAEIQETDIKDTSFFNTQAPLTTITLKNNDNLTSISSLENTTIEDLSVSWSQAIYDLSVLETLPSLNSLSINDTNISDTSIFEKLQLPLKRFYANGTKIDDIEFLTKMKFADAAKIKLDETLITDISSMSNFNATTGMNITLNNNHILDFSPLNHLADNDNIKITAHYQRITINAYENEVTKIPLITHVKDEELRFFSYPEQGINGSFGDFTPDPINRQITWHEANPVQYPGYNRVDLANFDLLKPKTAGNISYSLRILGNVTKRPLSIYTVTFDSNGGSLVDDVMVTDGDLLNKPENPTRNGFKFNGWYLSNPMEMTNSNLIEWNFENNPVTNNMTLYAGWSVINEETIVTEKEDNNKDDGTNKKKEDNNKKKKPNLPNAGYSTMLFEVVAIFILLSFIFTKKLSTKL